jgi:predicted DNA-binding transcriptional regulator AlpA
VPTSPREKRWLGSYFPIADSCGSVTQVAAVVVDLDFAKPIHLDQLPNHEVRVLRSWKDIARHLGTCVKTAQRWEQEQSFPVRRITRKNGAVVFAMSDEIEDWLRSRVVNQQRSRS